MYVANTDSVHQNFTHQTYLANPNFPVTMQPLILHNYVATYVTKQLNSTRLA